MTKVEKLQRLHKIIARAGVCSLREAERLIAQGRVSVNGETVRERGAAADPANDAIRVDGAVIETSVPHHYLLMNKPKGIVTTRSDEKGRKTVMDLLPPEYRHLYPIGRLDIMSEGLLILTNDGALAQALLTPKKHVERIYRVKVRNIPDEKSLNKLQRGLTIDGEKLSVAHAVVTSVTGKNAWLTVTLTEGKNRHIRRLFEPLGIPVMKLKRIAFGPVKLGGLKSGEVRHLTIETVNRLRKAGGVSKK